MNTDHIAIDGSQKVPLPGAQALGRVNSNAVMEVTLKLRRKKSLPILTTRPSKLMTRAEVAS